MIITRPTYLRELKKSRLFIGCVATAKFYCYAFVFWKQRLDEVGLTFEGSGIHLTKNEYFRFKITFASVENYS